MGPMDASGWGHSTSDARLTGLEVDVARDADFARPVSTLRPGGGLVACLRAPVSQTGFGQQPERIQRIVGERVHFGGRR